MKYESLLQWVIDHNPYWFSTILRFIQISSLLWWSKFCNKKGTGRNPPVPETPWCSRNFEDTLYPSVTRFGTGNDNRNRRMRKKRRRREMTICQHRQVPLFPSFSAPLSSVSVEWLTYILSLGKNVKYVFLNMLNVTMMKRSIDGWAIAERCLSGIFAI